MTTAIQSRQDLPAVIALLNRDTTEQELALVAPPGYNVKKAISLARLCILTGKISKKTGRNPLLDCTPQSVILAIKKSIQTGLDLDGRNAHLVAYGTECQFMIDWKGYVALGKRSGIPVIFPEKVCDNDEFDIWVDEAGRHMKHRYDVRKDRGPVIGYYSFTKDASGEVDYEYLPKSDVEAVRGRSRSSDNGPWVSDFDEMGKKTAIRRHQKRWDLSYEARAALSHDDDKYIDVDSEVKPDTGVAAMLNAPAQSHAALPAGAPVTRRGRPKQVAVEQASIAAQAGMVDASEPPLPPEARNFTRVENDDSDLGPQTQAEAVRESVAPPSQPPVAQPSGPVSAPATAPSTASAPPSRQTPATRQSQPDRIRGMLGFADITEEQLMDYLRTLGACPESCANLDQMANLSGNKLNAVIGSWEKIVEAVKGTQPA